jgi:hypothetical protein
VKVSPCAKESCVLAALASGSLPEELAEHLNACPDCRDAQLVWCYLNACATSDAETEIPPAHIVWWRAQLGRKRGAARRSVAWIDAMQKIAVAIATIAAAIIVAWQSPKLFGISPLVLGASATVLVLFVASLVVVLTLDGGRTLPRSM